MLWATDNDEPTKDFPVSRRKILTTAVPASFGFLLPMMRTTENVAAAGPLDTAGNFYSSPVLLAAASTGTSMAAVTDKIFLDVKGIPAPASEGRGSKNNAQAVSAVSSSVLPTRRIVIGLFGNNAPDSVAKVKRLVTSGGLVTPCKPLASRTLQKEQLEANKVYTVCIEHANEGVNLKYSTIWRIVPDYRIDIGAVSGKYIAREYPLWDEGSNSATLQHDQPGVVSVRRGNDGGFGFSIYPGSSSGDEEAILNPELSSQLDAENIVIGRVLEGMDVVNSLNTRVPVVQSAAVSSVSSLSSAKYSSLRTSPSRSCRYGGNDLFCNEYKPLVKLSIADAGIVS
jgi:cyclophilin family peptidyl-prolyl cis-trans isomerase